MKTNERPVSASLKKRWGKALENRLNDVSRLRGTPAGASAVFGFLLSQARLRDDANAAAAWGRLREMAIKNPKLLTEPVESDASAVELLLTAGDWEGGFELMGMAPESLCASPKRRLGMASCAARGFMKGVSRSRELDPAAMELFAREAQERGDSLGPARLMALAEEAELMLIDRQQWDEEELGKGRVFLGYAGFQGSAWDGKIQQALRGLKAEAERRALGSQTESSLDEPAPGRPARFL